MGNKQKLSHCFGSCVIIVATVMPTLRLQPAAGKCSLAYRLETAILTDQNLRTSTSKLTKHLVCLIHSKPKK